MKRKGLLILLIVLLSATPALAQQSVVAKYRAQYPTPMNQAQLLALERAVAAEVHGGLLVKPDGSNCGGYACDIICRSDSELYDILGDADGSATPQWNPTTNPRGYHCEVIASTDPPPPPPPDLTAKVAALEARVTALEAKTTTTTPPPPGDVAADVKRIRELLELVAKRFGLQP